MAELQAIHRLVQQQLEKAKADYKSFADRLRRDTPLLTVGDRVRLSTRNLPSTWPAKKLDHRYVGPFPIEAVINPVTYRLTLPRSLRPACPLRRAKPPPLEQQDGDSAPKYEVASIQDSHWVKGRCQYLIEWKGYRPEEFTWEDLTTIHASALVTAFHEQFPSQPHPDRQTWGKGPAMQDSVVIPCQPVFPTAESGESEEEVEEAFEGPSGSEGGSDELQDSRFDEEPGPSSRVPDEAQLCGENESDLEDSHLMDMMIDARRCWQLVRADQQQSIQQLQGRRRRH
ncbi:hypothetical protein NXF25_019010 [Crotalus adamanteus]|uniref:Chromo domain-containing protein n=1 Tax=Crotalus adamanteus TaxID=8729 RepID=A0AAW1B178_CROAD